LVIVIALLPTLMGSWLDLASSLSTSWWCPGPGGECEREAVTSDVDEDDGETLVTAVLSVVLGALAGWLTTRDTELALLDGLVAALLLTPAPGGVGGLDLLFDIFGVFPVNKSIFKLS